MNSVGVETATEANSKKKIVTLKSLLNREFTVQIPSGEISNEGLLEVKSLLESNNLPVPTIEQVSALWQDIRGTYPKRLRKFIQKEGKELPVSVMADIGALAQRYAGGIAETYFFKIVPPPFSWNDGEFGKEKSCWWTQGHKTHWEAMDGHCILFYKTANYIRDNGVGRIWIGEQKPGVFLIFNGYYNYDDAINYSLKLTKAVATCLGLTYRKIELESKKMFLNGHSGYIVGDPESTNEYLNELTIGDKLPYLHIEPPIVRKVFCKYCKIKIQNEEDELRQGPYIYCRSCFEVQFFYCDHCGALSSKETRYRAYIEGGRKCHICTKCRSYHFLKCFDCGDYHATPCMLVVQQQTFCKSCFEKNTFKCQGCKQRFSNIEKHEYKTPNCCFCDKELLPKEELNLCITCYVSKSKLETENLILI